MEIRTILKQSKKRKSWSQIAAARLFSIAALATAAGSAYAADLPSRMPPPVLPAPVPAFTWTGFYLGANAGFGVDHFAFPFAVNAPSYFEGRSGITAVGGIIGVQAGFNYQIQSDIFQLPLTNVVLGVEIDNDWSSIRGHSTVSSPLPGGAVGAASFGSKFLNFGTLRGRVGYAFGRFLPYFTAGLTYGTTNTYYTAATSDPYFSSASTTVTRTGIAPHVGVVGIGLEYGLSNNVTIKAEYLYEFINARTMVFNTSSTTSVQFLTRTMYHVGRVGLNYKFDWFSPSAPPVLAKY
ncbi:outer membrane protein [Methylocapsa aurea]|uniref:outer membrane protein n=1 Tax=Methylocapsa aurea TaxID=663610 RepID=UPI00055EDF02|nr:outer membrane beta-barrel protein [Methylocapsa aurea]